MIRALFLLISIGFFFTASAQKPTYYQGLGLQMKQMWADSVARIPSDTTLNKTGIARIGTTIYAGNGTYWTAAAGGAANDTTSLSNRINLKVNISDTAAMLNPYLRKIDTTGKWVHRMYKNATADSFVYEIGTMRFAFKDSSGAGSFARDTIVAGRGLTGTPISANKVQLDNDSAVYIITQINDTTLSFTHFDGRIDTVTIVSSGGGGGSGAPFGYTLSTTQPTDTSVGWINLNYNILQCYPVQYHVNGAWTQVDTIGGQFYDNIGKVFSRGYPYKIIATGQSNLGGSYIGEAANPNAAPYNGYYGDTIPARAVAAWNNNQNIWVVAKIRDTPFQYSSGANYLLLAAKKINERTGRSVRIVTYPQGGTGLQCWAGVPGTPPQDSACYNEFKSRVQSSGLLHPDLFIWAQSEAGITPAPTNTTYFDKWKEMVDSMIARDHLIDTTTLKILMASGDTLTNPNDLYTANNGTSGGEGALRALAATNDRTIKYVDAIYFETMLSDGLHFMPKGHEEIATRLFNSIMEGQKNPSRDMMGYGGIAPYKFSGNQQKLGATGLTFVNNAGTNYIDLEGASNSITRYTGATANASNQYSDGLYFDPVNTNTVRLYHFNNTTKVQLEDTRVLTSNIVAQQSVEAYAGADPEFVLNDIALGKKWKFQMINASNELEFEYDGTKRFHFTKTGELGIGITGAELPDSSFRTKTGIWGERGVRFSGLPSNQTYSKSLGVTSNGTLYLKDTLAVSGVYAPLASPTFTTPTLGVALATSLGITGTAGAGFVRYLTQSSAPATPASGFSLYADASNRFAWKGANGWVRTFDGTANTADRSYTLQDSSGTVAHVANQTFTGIVTMPILTGGKTTTSPLSIYATTGVAAAGASVIFKGGTNGGTTFTTMNSSGNWDFGSGTITTTGNITGFNWLGSGFVRAAAASYIGWNGRATFYSSADGVIDARNNANSQYASIQTLYDRFGSGSPESVVTAPVGAVYHRTDGGAGTSLYVKESGTGNTGWVAK